MLLCPHMQKVSGFCLLYTSGNNGFACRRCLSKPVVIKAVVKKSRCIIPSILTVKDHCKKTHSVSGCRSYETLARLLGGSRFYSVGPWVQPEQPVGVVKGYDYILVSFYDILFFSSNKVLKIRVSEAGFGYECQVKGGGVMIWMAKAVGVLESGVYLSLIHI